ncbi:MAG: response regulator [Lachnospiraceae bacterium]|nr:response regulator [Lachnospiraceae bacterium]
MAYWVIVVDDDAGNLKMAGHILSRANMRVTALRSGNALIEYVEKNGFPNLVLLDIMMPEMDGFETLTAFREKEKEMGVSEVPVVFLSADDEVDTERRGFEMGVSDFIKKPFDPDILVKRVNNLLTTYDQMNSFETKATLDSLTGLLNKENATEQAAAMCRESKGFLAVLDLDSFKLVNDIYGHETGDDLLIRFTLVLKECIKCKSVVGRIGGDEFMVFFEGASEADIREFSDKINERIVTETQNLLGDQMVIPIGVSTGAVAVPEAGTDFAEVFRLADRELYRVKENGKHGVEIYSPDLKGDITEVPDDINLSTLSRILEERNVPQSAMWMGKEAFGNIYRYMLRYMDRYQGTAYKLLYSVETDESVDEKKRLDIIDRARELLQFSLRNSDIMMQIGENHFFLLLPEINEYNAKRVTDRIQKAWKREDYSSLAVLNVDMDSVNHEIREHHKAKEKEPDWVVVVDDDKSNLMMVGNILSKNNIRVSALQSGQAFLNFIKENRPNLVLMDVNMPDMDGFETFEKMKEMLGAAASRVPVIFLTADEGEDTETKGLELGAMDFVRKPIIPGNLILRVRHTLELVLLQNHLFEEVDRKTEENRNLSIHIVKALAAAIDAKDTYTNGHSSRVAEYTKQIAMRFGYPEEKLDDIYMMGLLHDVGKIGIPDAIINKPAKLTEEEYEVIKTHPVMGSRILKSISEMPSLAMGARWHHERYDGTGYPDGLKGDDIPEEARIIAVADSYDAMSSSRSYRGILPQEKIREELEKGRGTQFDPKFADIMLDMMNEDTEYKLKGE